MKLKRGDIVLVWFPNSDLTSLKRRPALVVQRDDLKSGLSQVVLAMITSNLARAGHPSRVPVAKTAVNRLLMDSVVMTDNVATVLEKAVDRKWGRIENMLPVDDALRHTLGL